MSHTTPARKKHFPCPYCKGSGIIESGDINDDGIQISPDTECGYCEGEGLIEIGGKIHTNHYAFSIGCKILWQPGKINNRSYSRKYITNIGKKALKLI